MYWFACWQVMMTSNIIMITMKGEFLRENFQKDTEMLKKENASILKP